MLEIWGRDNSINVQKPLWAAAACGVSVDRKDVGGPFGGLDTQEYGKLNPNRLIPVMRDDNFILWESNAIVRYIAEKYGSPSNFYPQNSQARARAHQWLEWVNSTFYANLIPVFLQIYRVPEPEQDKTLITEKITALNDKLPIADHYFAEQNHKYTAADNITFGDLGLGTLLYRYYNMPITRADCPNLHAYYERLTQDTHFQNICMLPLK